MTDCTTRIWEGDRWLSRAGHGGGSHPGTITVPWTSLRPASRVERLLRDD